MAVLVIAEHDKRALKPATAATPSPPPASRKSAGGEVHILVAGKDCRGRRRSRSEDRRRRKVLLADDAAYDARSGRELAPLIARW